MKKSKYEDIGLLCQMAVTIFLIMFLIIYAFLKTNEFLCLIGFILVILMFIMAFNNHIVFKRKYFTLIYIAIGIIALVMSIMNYFSI